MKVTTPCSNLSLLQEWELCCPIQIQLSNSALYKWAYLHQELGSTIHRIFKCKIVFLDCLQAVKHYFSQLGAKLDLSLEVSFQKDEITLDIPEEVETEEGWKITPISYPLVSLYHIPYCSKQALMGARSSSVKNWGWAVTQRMSLNGSTIPVQGPTPDVKLAARGYQIDLHRCFFRALLRPARQ